MAKIPSRAAGIYARQRVRISLLIEPGDPRRVQKKNKAISELTPEMQKPHEKYDGVATRAPNAEEGSFEVKRTAKKRDRYPTSVTGELSIETVHTDGFGLLDPARFGR